MKMRGGGGSEKLERCGGRGKAKWGGCPEMERALPYIGIVIVLIVLIVITTVLIIHANNKNSGRYFYFVILTSTSCK